MGASEPRYVRIKNDLIRRIRAGEWAEGAYLPTERELCETHGVSRITARRVLDDLQSEGYIVRSRALGSRVISCAPAGSQAPVLCILPFEEHLAMPLVQLIGAGLQRHGIGMALRDRNILNTPEDWKAALQAPFHAVVTFGPVNEPISRELRASNSKNAPMLQLINCNPEDNAFSTFISSDFKHGGHIAAEHCLRQGYRNLAYFTYPLQSSHRSHYYQLEGIRAACADAEVPLSVHDFFQPDMEENDPRVLRMLTALPRPCAIVSDADYKLSFLYRALQHLGIKVPTEMGLTGYFNTPWAVSMGFTSVDIQKDVLARLTVEAILQKQRGHILVPPALIARSSTALGAGTP